MLNKCIFIGRLTRDPELRHGGTGIAIATFTLAVNRFNNQEADFLPIKLFKKQAENAANYLKKGSLCAVEARVQTGSYEKDGKKQFTTDFVANQVVFLDQKSSNDSKNEQPVEISDDDLPF
ncbi:single-stranded DNA-binding protein [Cytobacillus sp. IB215665]|uniref:single-stranded DNA-binding protein n=1 Tax=Cytobacillus sp. IB215665 TaxID=3097357 RepID=UPI002A1537FD|nr:single-stranded DNA-binding protein [Cytobacillus sp. IB215665]MDX8367839.1 single-stranded DNA-binding protein [Cytobacillus sp. IB215665]